MKFILQEITLVCLGLFISGQTYAQTYLTSESMSGGNFSFTIHGSPSTSVDVEASADLITWTNIGTIALIGSSSNFVDTAASSFSNRFYCLEQGGTCSTNTVGFITSVIPTTTAGGSSAYTAIANQLNNPSGNTVDVLFSALPNKSQVLVWDTSIDGYITASRSGTPSTWNNNFLLNPSQGAFVHAGGSSPVTVTFVGEVPQGPQANTNFPSPVSAYSLLGSIQPRAGSLVDLVFPGVKGDQIEQWDNIGQQWVTNAIFTNGYWSPSALNIRIGESFFLQSSSSNRTWWEDFPVTPCAQEQPWSFIQIGDLHAGSSLNGYSWTNALNTILASNQAWNLKLIISPGDCYEQNTNMFFWANVGGRFGGEAMTNGMWHIKTNGISWMNVPGNHDSDYIFEPNVATNIAYWNDVFGTNFYASDPYWYSNRIAGDTRDILFNCTNGTTKVLFVGLRWIDSTNFPAAFATTNDTFAAYSTNCNWASNVARAYPDHLIVPIMHYFMDTNGIPNTEDFPGAAYINEGPGLVSWNALKSATNLMMILSGHVRANPMVKSSLQCDDGHMVDSIKFNTQNEPIEGTNVIKNGGCFVLYTVYPSEHYVRGKVFASDYNRFLTNGEFVGSGFVNDWTFPFRRLP